MTKKTRTWNPSTEARSDIQYVDVTAVSRERLEIVHATRLPGASAPSRARKIIETGDTIIATIRPALKRVAQVPVSFHGEIASTAFCVLRPDTGLVDPDYLFFAVSSDDFAAAVSELATGASYPAVRDNDVLDRSIPIPPLTDQQQIASVLKVLRRVLTLQFRTVQVATDLKRAAMHELFTRGLRGEPQKESEIGPVPESWRVDPIAAHHSIVSGGTPSRGNPVFWTGGTIPWVKTTEVNYTVILGTEEHITQAGLDGSAARLLPAGTLLLAMYGQGVTRGKVAILGIDAACNQACAAIRPTDGSVETKYLYHFLASRYYAIRQLAHGGQQQNLNLDIVRELRVAFAPSLDEQREIVAILDALDRKIELHRQKRAVLEELFKALLHKLMTGEIRAADLDLSALDGSTPGTEEASA